VVIFDHSGHRAILTPIGELILREGTALLSQARHLEQRINLHKTGWEGVIHILYNDLIPFEQLAVLAKNFQQECPKISVSLRRASSRKCWQALSLNEASLALGITQDPPMELFYGQKRIGRMEFILVAAAFHPLAQHKKSLSLDEIKTAHTFVTQGDGAAADGRAIAAHNCFFETNSFADRISAIRTGVGVGFLPELWARPFLENGELVAISGEETRCSVPLSMVWRKDAEGQAHTWWVKKSERLIKSLVKEASNAR
jgi:DNA-binding transcriptional LysR family regulator